MQTRCVNYRRTGACIVISICVNEGKMEEDVAEFVQQCLHCVDSRAGNVVPRPLGEILYGMKI